MTTWVPNEVLPPCLGLPADLAVDSLPAVLGAVRDLALDSQKPAVLEPDGNITLRTGDLALAAVPAPFKPVEYQDRVPTLVQGGVRLSEGRRNRGFLSA